MSASPSPPQIMDFWPPARSNSTTGTHLQPEAAAATATLSLMSSNRTVWLRLRLRRLARARADGGSVLARQGRAVECLLVNGTSVCCPTKCLVAVMAGIEARCGRSEQRCRPPRNRRQRASRRGLLLIDDCAQGGGRRHARRQLSSAAQWVMPAQPQWGRAASGPHLDPVGGVPSPPGAPHGRRWRSWGRYGRRWRTNAGVAVPLLSSLDPPNHFRWGKGAAAQGGAFPAARRRRGALVGAVCGAVSEPWAFARADPRKAVFATKVGLALALITVPWAARSRRQAASCTS
jgi:hypothetical protein